MFKVIQAGNFTGGMTTQSQSKLIFVNSTAIITNGDPFVAPLFNLNFDTRGTGIQAVFHQLFDNRCRAFNHFSGGNLIG
jgi:hypothetical protein